MRRLVPLTSKSSITVGLIIVYAVLRTSASIGQPIARFADTPGYETLRFFGTTDRFWPVPLVFQVASSDALRVILQVGIGVVAWAWLGLLLSRISRFPLAMLIAVLIVGLSPQVVRYDVAILSESLGISFAVMAVSATLSLVRTRTNMSRVIWCVMITLCSMTRPVHLVILFACASWTAFVFFRRSRMSMAIPTAVLGLLAVWGMTMLMGNRSTTMLNMYTVLAERVIPDDARYEWFVAHGMPDVPGVRQSEGYDFSEELDPQLAAIVTLPVGQAPPASVRAGGVPLATWVRDDAWTTYARYVVSHPSDSMHRLRSLARPTLSPANDDFLPLRSRDVIPRVLFGDWRLWTLGGLLCVAVGTLRSSQLALIKSLAAMYALTFVVHSASMFTSGIEHPRHGVTTAVIVRVLPLVGLAAMTARSMLTTERAQDADERA